MMNVLKNFGSGAVVCAAAMITLVACSAAIAAPADPSPEGAVVQDAAPLPLTMGPTDPKIRYSGRFDTADAAGPRCSWSASAVEVRFTGTALNVVMSDSGSRDAYQVVVDGRPAQVLTTQTGRHIYSLLRDAPGGTHTVDLVKRTEAFCGVTQFQGFQLSADGTMLAPPPKPARRLEVIGDSISCGYGNEAKDRTEHFSPETENAYLTYGAIAARALGADYVCTAWSGRRMWPNNTMDEIYGLSLPTVPDSRWDFSRWVPQAVVIALGTNDINGGIPDGPAWVAGYKAFLARVRKNYPRAVLYCASSPMLDGPSDTNVRSYLHQVVQEENAAGDKNVRFLDFPTQRAADGYGADWHPSVKTHRILAQRLEATLRTDLGWAPSGGSEASH